MELRPIVCKLGTEPLFASNGRFDHSVFRRHLATLRELQRQGYDPLFVLSGAVAYGRADDADLQSYQARAARGQLLLVGEVLNAARMEQLRFALFLLSQNDIVNRNRYDGLRVTMRECLKTKAIPLINENDATSEVGRHDFLDNDQVATIVAVMVGADRVVIFTGVDGVYPNDPLMSGIGQQEPIHIIRDVNEELLRLHLGQHSTKGRGGMEAKLRAARLASLVGITTHIVNGRDPERVVDALKGKAYGTTCLPWSKPLRLRERNRWLLASYTSSASIEVDDGAAKALRERKSLLAVGVKRVYGAFDANVIVEVIDSSRRPLALGLSALSNRELAKLLRKDRRPYNVEVIHADNLTLFPV